jgi:hypothetical protein
LVAKPSVHAGGFFIYLLDLLIPETYSAVKYFLIPKYMNKKMGRPPLPKGQSKDVQIGVRFNPADDKQIEKAVAKSGQTKPDFIRNAALAETRKPTVWVKSKWTMEQLSGKTVEFALTVPGRRDDGTGKFLVRKNPADELAIDICAIASATRYEMVEIRYHLYQAAADKIELHPNPKVAQFRLLM